MNKITPLDKDVRRRTAIAKIITSNKSPVAKLGAIDNLMMQERIDELDCLPRTGWISNGIRYEVIPFTSIDNRKAELRDKLIK